MPYGKSKRTPTKSKATYGSGSGMGRKAAAKKGAKAKKSYGLTGGVRKLKGRTAARMKALGL